MFHAVGIMSTPTSSEMRRHNFRVALIVRGALVVVAVGIMLLFGWMTPGRALLTTSLLIAVVAGTAVYEFYASHAEQPSGGFSLVASALVAASLIIPQWGSDKLQSAVIASLVVVPVLYASRSWIVRAQRTSEDRAS